MEIKQPWLKWYKNSKGRQWTVVFERKDGGCFTVWFGDSRLNSPEFGIEVLKQLIDNYANSDPTIDQSESVLVINHWAPA